MASDRYPRTDAAMLNWAAHHATVWEGGQGGPPDIGLSAQQLVDFRNSVDSAESAYSNQIAKAAESLAATEDKQTAFEDLLGQIGSTMATIDAYFKTTRDPGVYSRAQVPTPKDPSERPAPPQPTNLVATLRLDGTIEVAFKAATGGGAQYLVQRQTTSVDGVTGDYVFLGFADDDKKFVDTAVPEGLKSVGYRVSARLSTGLSSDWSPTYTLPFGGSQGESGQAATAGSIAPVSGEDQQAAG